MVITVPAGATPDTAAPELPAELQPARLRPLMRGYSGPLDLDGQLRLCARLAGARIGIPRVYRDNPDDLLALMQVAISLDIQLANAWKNIHFNVEGVPGMRAVLMHALVIRAGHRIVPTHVDERLVRLHLHRTDGMPSGSAKWSVLEAHRANLHTKDRSPWVPYPEDMLWARATSRLCRRYAPDITEGMYELAELDSIPVIDEIDAADMSTAMRDIDGELVPAPDVVKLLTDLDTRTHEEIQGLWKIATQEGMLGAYAGTIDGIAHTVDEVLYSAGVAAAPRETITATPPADTPPADDADGATAQHPPTEFTLTPPAAPTLLQQPAGTPGVLECGCDPAAVLAAGNHQEGCTR